MSDESCSNICECIFNHEIAMRRLLSVIRNSQTNCNDHECFETSTSENADQEATTNLALITVLIVAFMFLYFSSGWMRPGSNNNRNEKKPNGNGQSGSNGGPPSPSSPAIM